MKKVTKETRAIKVIHTIINVNKAKFGYGEWIDYQALQVFQASQVLLLLWELPVPLVVLPLQLRCCCGAVGAVGMLDHFIFLLLTSMIQMTLQGRTLC